MLVFVYLVALALVAFWALATLRPRRLVYRFHDPELARMARLARGLGLVMQTQAPMPGQFFDVPGVPGGETQWLEEYEPTQGLAFSALTGSQIVVNGILPFKQTDVVLDWIMEMNVQQTYTAGTSALTTSLYAPFNFIGPTKLLIQNQYACVDVESGIDLYIFNLIRPQRQNIGADTLLGAAPAGFFIGSTALGYPAVGLAQPNLEWAAQWTTATTTYNLILRLPAGQWFDIYYDRAITGEPVAAPHAAIVSPQMMAGTTRVITPNLRINQGNAATTDIGPVNIGAGSGTFVTTGSTLSFRRQGVYAGNPAVMPPVYAWQYRWLTTRIGISGQQRSVLPVPLDAGQVLAFYVRLFDPSANTGLGLPIALTAISTAPGSLSFQYGSGLNRFTGTALEWQERWIRQHGVLLPAGVVCLDMALDERGLITNKRVLNTLTTAGIQAVIQFTGAQSATSYAVLGLESLVYVT